VKARRIQQGKRIKSFVYSNNTKNTDVGAGAVPNACGESPLSVKQEVSSVKME